MATHSMVAHCINKRVGYHRPLAGPFCLFLPGEAWEGEHSTLRLCLAKDPLEVTTLDVLFETRVER